jgi:hypothetical protein
MGEKDGKVKSARAGGEWYGIQRMPIAPKAREGQEEYLFQSFGS